MDCPRSQRQGSFRPLAEVRHVSYGWGFKHKGMFVDDRGGLWQYDLSSSDDTVRWPLERRVAASKPSGNMCPADWEALTSLLPSGRLVAPLVPTGGYSNDAGATQFFLHGPRGQTLLLAVRGDQPSERRDARTAHIVVLLRDAYRGKTC